MAVQTAQVSDERALVEAAQGDPRLFGDLYERNFDRVYAYVARRVQDRDAAQDVTADVFHQALANLKKFEWRGVPFVAWLLRIAANTIADRWEKFAREKGNPAEEPHADPVAQREMEEVERQAMLAKLVRGLPEIQRRVVYERFVEQRSIREIAHELKKTEGAVKQLQFRAIHALRAQMEEQHG